MNSLWQVARTYLWRPRFWVLGAIYLAIMGLAFWSPETPANAQIGVSLALSCLIVCFTALHLRRTFGNEVVQLTPHYAAPHLAVGLLASALLWLIVPAILVLVGKWPPTALAALAVAGIMAGAVAFWPRALIVLVALPFLLSWSSNFNQRRPFFSRMLDGDEPLAAAMLFAAALLANAAAVVALVRLPRRGISTNDELAIDAPVRSQVANPATAWLLVLCDRAAERLQHAGLLHSVQRWRVPVASSFLHFLIAPAAVLAMAGIGWVFDAVQDWVVVGTVVSVAVMLIVPYGPWHQRRRAFQQEFLRPVAREPFFRQLALALAWDVGAWLLAALLLESTVIASFAWFSSPSAPLELLTGLAIYGLVLVNAAVLLYGLALATMRFRMWLLIVAVGGAVWLLGVWMAIVLLTVELGLGLRNSLVTPFTIYLILTAGIGGLLTLHTLRRWSRIDLC